MSSSHPSHGAAPHRATLFLAPLTLALAIVVAGSCDSPTKPVELEEPQPEVIALDAIVDGELEAGETDRYDVTVAKDQAFVVLLETLAGAQILVLWDSVEARQIAILRGEANGEPLGSNGTLPRRTELTTRFRITVTGSGGYRLQVYVPDPAPEHAERLIVPGDTIDTEDIYARIDTDEFTLRGEAGDEFIAYVQALDAQAGGQLRLTVEGVPGTTYPAVSGGGDDELELQATGRFTLPADGDYVVRLSGTGLFGSYVGPYRFQVRRVDRRPEHASRPAIVGDTTVGESLDYVGDIDEFVITGSPGEEYNVLFQVRTGAAADVMLLGIPDGQPSTGEPAVVQSTGRDSLLTDRGSGRFALPASGRAIVRVEAANGGVTRGAFALYVHRVDRRAESGLSSLAIGDSAIADGLETPGDIDELTVTVPAPTRANLLLTVDPASPWAADGITGVRAALLSVSGAEVAGTSYFGSPDWAGASGVFDLPAGEYRLRIAATAARVQSFHGSYRIHLYESRATPELAPSLVAIGDTVTETLDPLGDVDTFIFEGTRGTYLDVLFQGLGTESGGGYALGVAPEGRLGTLGQTSSATWSPSLGERRTGRFTLPETGRYEIRIGAMNVGRIPMERGPYRFALVELSANPETHASVLATGETVDDEQLDSPGDVDEFSLRGSPGEEVVLFLTAGAATQGVQVDVIDALTSDSIASTPSYIATESTGRIVLPASGEVHVRVSEPEYRVGRYTLVGGYRLDIVRIDRAPEVAAAAIALGDTVEGEAIDPHGDIDEFRVAGAAGQRVMLLFQTPNGVDGYDGLIVEIIEPGSGRVVTSAWSNNPTGELGSIASPAATLAVDGEHLVRVRGVDDRRGRAPYRFTVRVVP